MRQEENEKEFVKVMEWDFLIVMVSLWNVTLGSKLTTM
jgi:hypothetical protein